MKKLKAVIVITILLTILANILAPISFATNEILNEQSKQENEIKSDINKTENEQKDDNLNEIDNKEEQNTITQEIIENQNEEQKVFLENRTTPIKSILNIDTNLNNAKFDKSGIHIDGWKLATEADTKLQIFIDNNQVNENYIKYSYKYDLISIVKGYGTYTENPKPNFDIDIPVNNIAKGNHTLRIDMVATDGAILERVENNIYIDKNTKSVLNIDTNLNNATFDKGGIHIDGWKLATVENTTLRVYIDNNQIDNNCIKYTRKYDLISIVKGYGTYTENPKPNFDIDIPVNNVVQGNHTLRIDMVATDGAILQKVENNIYIDKNEKSILNIDTDVSTVKFDKYGIHIDGWKLSTAENTTLRVYIDNNQIDNNFITYTRKYDLISIVKGYGTYAENPKPNFDINIPTNNLVHGNHTLRIDMVATDGAVLERVENNIFIDKSIKSYLNIDTLLNLQTFGRDGIHVEGWKLATEPDTKLNVYIDNSKIDDKYTKYSYKYDLTSIVKEYGDATDNPRPNFDIDIPKELVTDGTHILRIDFTNSDGTVLLKRVAVTIYMKKEYKGIDVSQFNNNINWNAVKSTGVEFAMVRIGYRGYRNPVFVLDSQALINIRSAQAVGIKVGVYFVTQAINIQEAQEEALWVISTLDRNGIKLDYPVAIDVERSTASPDNPGRADLLDVETRTMVCRAFCDVIKYHGRTPMVYTSTNWFENYLDLKQLTVYDIWLANYSEPKLSAPFDMWQYTSQGTVMGILGNVDLNICYKRY